MQSDCRRLVIKQSNCLACRRFALRIAAGRPSNGPTIDSDWPSFNCYLITGGTWWTGIEGVVW